MKEAFVQFVWEKRFFDPNDLKTREGAEVEILHPGRLNHDQGPDFGQARIRLDGLLFAGAVEIHVNGREWYSHGHDRDPLYDQVCLHVVLRPSIRPPLRSDGTPIPEVCLEGRIPQNLQVRYDDLRITLSEIPCAGMVPGVPAKLKRDWANELGMRRLMRRSEGMRKRLPECGGDVGQLLYEELASALGGPVNGATFREIARAANQNILRRIATRPGAIRSLLFGLAGLVREADDPEWAHLRACHGLKPVALPLKRHRMRPASQPDRRLAQLALISAGQPQWVDLLQPEKALYFLQQEVQGGPGAEVRRRIYINTLLPLILVYGEMHGRGGLRAAVKAAMQALPAEYNRAVRRFTELGFAPADALESQGLIELGRHLCSPRHCLRCRIGGYLLERPAKASATLLPSP